MRLDLSAFQATFAMLISTTRFGSVEIDVDDILLFPHGLVAFESCRHWVLLSDAENETLGWLQSVNQGDVALPVVSPRRFVPQYRVHVTRGQLAPLELAHFDQTYVLSIVSKSDDELTLNLKAPLIINLDRRLGRQVIVTTDEQPLAWQLTGSSTAGLRKSA